MFFAGNYCGYQDVFCPLLEITVHITTSCVLCSKFGSWTPSTIHICRCISWRTLYLSSPLPPPRELARVEGVPQLRHDGFLRNPFHFSIYESQIISTLQRYADSVSAWCSLNNMCDAFRVFLTTILGISLMHSDCRHWIPPLPTRDSVDQGWPMSFLRSKFHVCGLYRVIADALKSVVLVSWSV